MNYATRELDPESLSEIAAYQDGRESAPRAASPRDCPGFIARESGSVPWHSSIYESELDLRSIEFESSGKRRKRIDLGEIVVCGGKPFAVLDKFRFNKSTLRKDSIRDHPAQVDAVARQIVHRKATGKPVPSVC